MTSWFIPIVAYVRISFLFKTEYYSVVMYIPHLVYPFIGQWTFELMPSFDLLCYCYSIFWLIVLWTQIYKNLFKSLLSVLLGIYPEVELLDQIVALYLVFWENNRLLSYILYPVTSYSVSSLNLNFSSVKKKRWTRSALLTLCVHIKLCCSVTQPCPTLCDPVDCSMPGFSVHHHLP